MTIQIQIPNKGHLTGTCGWVKKQLENSTLQIYRTTGNSFAIGIKFQDETNTTTVAFINNAHEQDGSYYYHTSYNTFEIHEEESNDDYFSNRQSLFGTLTPAASKYVAQFITDCSAKLREFVDNDEEITYDLTLKNI